MIRLGILRRMLTASPLKGLNTATRKASGSARVQVAAQGFFNRPARALPHQLGLASVQLTGFAATTKQWVQSGKARNMTTEAVAVAEPAVEVKDNPLLVVRIGRVC